MMSERVEPTLNDLAVPDSVLLSLDGKGGMGALLDAIPRTEELEAEAMIHKALSDPVRLRIMHALQHEALCPCILRKITDTTDSRLSYHLSRLEESGLVSYDKEKNWRIYYLTDSGREIIRRL